MLKTRHIAKVILLKLKKKKKNNLYITKMSGEN